MKFDWDQMPQVLASRKVGAVNELIRATSESASMFWRGHLAALEALERMPAEAEEEREYQLQREQQAGEDQ